MGGNERENEGSRGLQGVGAGVPLAETPFSFGFGFGSGNCGCGPWDLSSDPEGETESGGVKTLGRYLRTKGKAGWGNQLSIQS